MCRSARAASPGLRAPSLYTETGGPHSRHCTGFSFSPDGGAPFLDVARPLTTAFLRTLAEGLGACIKPEILPENVLARTPEMLAWWSPARHRTMFFNPAKYQVRHLNGRRYPHPALVFRVFNGNLFVRALVCDQRPTADTALRRAPYWNTSQEDGLVSRIDEDPRDDECRIDAWVGGELFCQRVHASVWSCASHKLSERSLRVVGEACRPQDCIPRRISH